MSLTPPAPPRPPSRWAFTRSADDRMFTGVTGGLAARLGVEAVVVRAAFLVLALAAGVGVALYAVAWAVSTAPVPDPGAGPAPPGDPVLAVAVALVVLGVLLMCRQLALWPGDVLVFSLAAVAAGACVLWSSTGGHAGRRRVGPGPGGGRDAVTGPARRVGTVRVGGGVVLVGFGLGVYVTGGLTGEGAVTVLVALGLAVGGTALVFGPWLRRLLGDLDRERRDRIRSEERAEVAAHLHDSVLQTLALIQRGAAQHRTHEVMQLARRQERELRAWLYGDRGAPAGQDGPSSDRLSGAVAAMAGDVEADHAVTVDVVVVGDGPVDAATAALLSAAREATVNAAKHALVAEVSVYVEAGEREVTAFVRDRGTGFDLAAVPADRHGIAHSIRGRLERHGGRVAITTASGRGTEVELRVPRATVVPGTDSSVRTWPEETGRE